MLCGNEESGGLLQMRKVSLVNGTLYFEGASATMVISMKAIMEKEQMQ